MSSKRHAYIYILKSSSKVEEGGRQRDKQEHRYTGIRIKRKKKWKGSQKLVETDYQAFVSLDRNNYETFYIHAYRNPYL